VRHIVLFLCACLPGLVWGTTYKCVDAQGRVSYSQSPEPGKRCAEASLPPLQTMPAPAPRAASPAGGQAADQSKTSEQELAEAKKALEEARRKLAEQEAVRYGEEKNYQRVLDRLKPYQEAVLKAEARLRELQQGGSQGTLAPRPGEPGKQ